MKSLGIVRKIDELGRVVIPAEVRRANGWVTGTPMEMFLDNEGKLILAAFGDSNEKDSVINELSKAVEGGNLKDINDAVNFAIRFIRRQ